MTSSENFASLVNCEPWMFQSTAAYAEPWLTEAFARDAETLTRALQKTISNDTYNKNNGSDTVVTSSDAVSSFSKPDRQITQSASGVSGSDPEMAAIVSQRRVPATRKITKRKPRATKKCQTTFIMADPANFRQMVQEVTGGRFETVQHQQSLNQLVVKPEPKRLTGNGLPLPTFDTSSFFVDYNLSSQRQLQQQQGGVGVGIGQRERTLTGVDGAVGQVSYVDSFSGAGGAGYGYEPYQNFPTLESWKVICD